MTLQEWLDKFFAPEYLNVQDPAAFKQQATDELNQVLQDHTPT